MPVSLFDKTVIAPLLRDYLDNQITDAVYDDNYLVKRFKHESFNGDQFSKACKVRRGGGVSPDFATSQANSTAAGYGKWRTDPKKLYKSVYIDNQALKNVKDENALVTVLTEAMDDGMAAFYQEIEIAMWGVGSGSRGTVGSVSTTALTLANVEDVVNFEVGDIIVAAAAEVSGGLDAGSVTITRINRDSGILYAAANWATGIAAIAAGRFLYHQGDRNAKAEGLLAHLPTVRSASPYTFQNIDLSLDWTRLGGLLVPSMNKPVGQALQDGMARAKREGCKPDRIVMSGNRANLLANELGQGRIVSNGDTKANIGFSGITLNTPNGRYEVDVATFCPDNYAFGLPRECRIVSQGKLIDYAGTGDETIRLSPTADTSEIRLASYANLFIGDPNNGIVFDFTA